MDFDTFFKIFVQIYIIFFILLLLDCILINIFYKDKIE